MQIAHRFIDCRLGVDLLCSLGDAMTSTRFCEGGHSKRVHEMHGQQTHSQAVECVIWLHHPSAFSTQQQQMVDVGTQALMHSTHSSFACACEASRGDLCEPPVPSRFRMATNACCILPASVLVPVYRTGVPVALARTRLLYTKVYGISHDLTLTK